MRLGSPILQQFGSPEEWIAVLRHSGFRAAYAPIGADSGSAERAEYRAAAAEADIVIAEVGAWSNPLSPDPAIARAAYEKIIAGIRLADDLGARCCVNIAGSRGVKWDGPSREDLTPDTFDAIVAFVQRVLDETRPQNTTYTLEPMPWMYPHSAESYQSLCEAIDRPGFSVHYDPVNIVTSPDKYFRSGDEIRHFVKAHGSKIVSVHAKDIVLGDELTVHLSECIPGEGGLDYPALLTAINSLHPDTPILVEHLETEAEYQQAVDHIRSVAASLQIDV